VQNNLDGGIKTDEFHRTNIEGVDAAGDNAFILPAISAAVVTATKARAFIRQSYKRKLLMF
jgi:thioredoxin reductase